MFGMAGGVRCWRWTTRSAEGGALTSIGVAAGWLIICYHHHRRFEAGLAKARAKAGL
jgi:hypothetical protein